MDKTWTFIHKYFIFKLVYRAHTGDSFIWEDSYQLYKKTFVSEYLNYYNQWDLWGLNATDIVAYFHIDVPVVLHGLQKTDQIQKSLFQNTLVHEHHMYMI